MVVRRYFFMNLKAQLSSGSNDSSSFARKSFKPVYNRKAPNTYMIQSNLATNSLPTVIKMILKMIAIRIPISKTLEKLMGFTLKNVNMIMNTKILSIESDHSSRYAEIYCMASVLPRSYQIKKQKASDNNTQKMVCHKAIFKLITVFFLLSNPRSRINATRITPLKTRYISWVVFIRFFTSCIFYALSIER